MPEPILYEQVYELLYQSLNKKINRPTLKRLTLLVLGIIRSKSASPASIAKALDEQGYKTPLCLVSDLPPDYRLMHIYARRYPIEALFRDYKSYGWHWEQGQVRDHQHMERLLVGMALATWVTIMAGTQVAEGYLPIPSTGNRRTVPWAGKFSLFHHGLQRLSKLLTGSCQIPVKWCLDHWDALNWQKQIYFHHARAYVLGINKKEPVCRYL